MIRTPSRTALLGFTAGCLMAAAVADAAVVAHWTFDETTGTTADDSAGTNDGTLVNFPGDDSQWQPGILGNALAFDGADDFVTHGQNLPRAEGTIAHWLNPADVGTHGVTVYESDSPAAGAAQYDGFGQPVTMLEIHAGLGDGAWQARYQDGDGSEGNNEDGFGRFGTASSTFPPTVGEWTHVAMTWDVDGDIVLYVNCQEVGRDSMAAGDFDGLITSERFIGRPSVAARFWDGLIDDVQIHDTALDQAGIEAVAQVCPQEAPPVVEIPTLSGATLSLLALSLLGAGWLLVRRT